MPIAPKHAFKEKSTKLLILLPLRTIYNCTFQCETPCRRSSWIVATMSTMTPHISILSCAPFTNWDNIKRDLWPAKRISWSIVILQRKNVAIPKPIKCLALCSFVHIDCSSSGDVCQTTNSRGKSREITTNIWVAFFTILNQSME